MTMTRRRTALGLILALALLMTGLLAAPAHAHGEVSKVGVIAGAIFPGYTDISDGYSPSGGISCADDIGAYSTTTRGRICAMKVAGVWSGSSFYPKSHVHRDHLAKYIRRAQRDLNDRYPARVTNITTWVEKHGRGCDQFTDVNCKPSAESHGIGFMNYHSIDRGKPWGSNTYKPGEPVVLCGLDCGLDQKINRWVQRAD